MDFLNSIPEWIGQASASVLMLIMLLIVTRFSQVTIFPFLKDLNDERRRLAEEQRAQREQLLVEYRELYEGRVLPTMKTLTDSLTNALEVQRVQYEGKLTMLENDRNIERAKLVAQIADLTAQIKTLSDRIAVLEKESLNKDAEIAELRERLKQVEAERDTLKAHLAALEAAESKRVGVNPDGDGQGHQKEEAP